MKFDFNLTGRGHLKKRESFDLEYKENFHLGDNLLKYIKTLAGMANNKGGIILFGVKDSPHIPLGMQNNKFLKLIHEKLIRKLESISLPN